MENQWEQAGDRQGGGGRGHGAVGEWEQKGARSGKPRRSPVGETSLFAGENKGEGEMMEEAELLGQKLFVVVSIHSAHTHEGENENTQGELINMCKQTCFSCSACDNQLSLFPFFSLCLALGQKQLDMKM